MGLMQKTDRNHLDKNGGLPPEALSSIENLFNEFYGTSDDDDDADEKEEEDHVED